MVFFKFFVGVDILVYNVDDCYNNVCKYKYYVGRKSCEEKIIYSFVIRLGSKISMIKNFYYKIW